MHQDISYLKINIYTFYLIEKQKIALADDQTDFLVKF